MKKAPFDRRLGETFNPRMISKLSRFVKAEIALAGQFGLWRSERSGCRSILSPGVWGFRAGIDEHDYGPPGRFSFSNILTNSATESTCIFRIPWPR
jgi:hypothetical protein